MTWLGIDWSQVWYHSVVPHMPVDQAGWIAIAAALGTTLALPGLANAALIDRGGGLIYDTDLDITWLADANYAVEDETGLYRFTGYFPDGALGANSIKVDFDELLIREATRVVVISPEHAIEDFLSIVERMGLHKVSYNVGWTAPGEWLLYTVDDNARWRAG